MFPTIIGTGLQEAIGSASLLKSEIVAAGIFDFFFYLLNSRDLPYSEAMAEQEWPALSPICKARQETILCPTQSRLSG